MADDYAIKVLYDDVELATKSGDITDLIESISISTSIESASGAAEISIVGDGAEYSFGSRIRIFYGDSLKFVGYLFSVSMSNTDRFSATFYDQTRYLKNTDVLVCKQMTASDVFRKVCELAELRTGTIDESSYILPANVYEGQSLWDVIQDAIDQTQAYEKGNPKYIVRDVAGKLEFRNIENLTTDFVIDDEGTALGFNYTIGIDQNTFNRVKLGWENQSGGAREWAIAENRGEIVKRGLLQFYELTRGDKSPMQKLKQRCEERLAMCVFPTQEMQVECHGDFRVSAGSGVLVNVPSIIALDGMHGFYISSCTHSITPDKHTMSLTLATQNFGG